MSWRQQQRPPLYPTTVYAPRVSLVLAPEFLLPLLHAPLLFYRRAAPESARGLIGTALLTLSDASLSTVLELGAAVCMPMARDAAAFRLVGSADNWVAVYLYDTLELDALLRLGGAK